MTTDKTTVIQIHNVPGWELDPVMLGAVMTRLARHVPEAKLIDVYPLPREANGWCEWRMNIRYHDDHRITIGCVQRSLESEVEFHS